jgi:hypothetical protein
MQAENPIRRNQPATQQEHDAVDPPFSKLLAFGIDSRRNLRRNIVFPPTRLESMTNAGEKAARDVKRARRIGDGSSWKMVRSLACSSRGRPPPRGSPSEQSRELRIERAEALRGLRLVREQPEVLELEARRHGTADERVAAEGSRCLRAAGGNDRDRPRAALRRADNDPAKSRLARVTHEELEGRTLGEVPRLVGENAVPAAERARGEQKMDRRQRTPLLAGARPSDARGRPVDFPEVASLGMRGKAERFDDLPGSRIHAGILRPRALFFPCRRGAAIG